MTYTHTTTTTTTHSPPLYNTKQVETVAFLENLAVKDVVEKETFFKRLPGVVPSLPQPVNERKVLPLLSSALEFGGAPPMALSTLLKIGTSLPEEEYTKKVRRGGDGG